MHLWFHAQLTQKILNGIYATYLPLKSLTNLLLTHHMLLIDIVDVAYCKVVVESGAPE